MKLNWGWGVVLALAGFIGFIMFFFIKAQTIRQDDLTYIDYYERGLDHDTRQEWIRNAEGLSGDIEIIAFQNGDIGFEVPEELKGNKVSGEIKFMRTNNAKIDIAISVDEMVIDELKIESDKFLKGNYRFNAMIVADGVIYYWDRNYIH